MFVLDHQANDLGTKISLIQDIRLPYFKGRWIHEAINRSHLSRKHDVQCEDDLEMIGSHNVKSDAMSSRSWDQNMSAVRVACEWCVIVV